MCHPFYGHFFRPLYEFFRTLPVSVIVSTPKQGGALLCPCVQTILEYFTKSNVSVRVTSMI